MLALCTSFMVVDHAVIEVDSEERLAITRLKRGEMGAMTLLVERYQIKAIRAAYLITQDVRMAEDVVQDTYLNIYHHIHQFDEQRRFEPYLMRSVCNAAIKAAQRADRNQSLDTAPRKVAGATRSTLGEMLVAGVPPVEDLIEETEVKERISQAMRELPPRMRAVVVQRYFLQMSEQQMSQELNSPPGTIKWLLNAARKQLRVLLEPERKSFHE